MSLFPPFSAFTNMRTEEDPCLPSTALPLGLGLATLRAPKNIYYDCWPDPEVLRRQLDQCTDPNCPLLHNARYLTVEARREKARRRQDEKKQLRDLVKHNLTREKGLIKHHKDLNDEFRKQEQALRKRERNLLEREKVLHELELNLKQQGRNAEENVSQGNQLNDVGAQPNHQPLHNSQKDLPTEHPETVEDGPDGFFPPSAVSPSTPSLPKTPPTSPHPTASIPSSSPIQSPCPQPNISTQEAANHLSYSCIKCARPDDQLMIACQNGKACLSRKWCQTGGGIHSGSDAWFHISHLGMTEAELCEFTKSKEAWYCPMCQKPTENTNPDKYTMIKLRRQAEIHDPKNPTTTKRCRQAVTPDSKKSTNDEKGTKKSNRRKPVLWKNPLECAALIDSMRTVIYANDQTERRYATASVLMLTRGFDRSPWQIKNKWNRELRKEAQRQGVPEDRHEKAGRKLVTGVQSPADRKRKREEERRALEAAERRLVEKGNMKKMEMEDEDEDGEGEEDDYEEHDDDDDGDEDDEEGEPKPKKQRFS